MINCNLCHFGENSKKVIFRNNNAEPLFNGMTFDWSADCKENFYRVQKDKKYNFVSDKGLLSPIWFDFAEDFCEGCAIVKINNQGYNFINADGKIMSSEWFWAMTTFHNGFAIVRNLFNEENFIDKNGDILFPNRWYDECWEFENGLARICDTDKGWNFITIDGDLLFDENWIDCIYVEDFVNGFAIIRLNDRSYNFIDIDGNIMFPNKKWDRCYNFYCGCAKVVKGDKEWFINTQGKYICSSKKYSTLTQFNEGFAAVINNQKGCTFINTQGKEICPNMYFNEAFPFKNGMAKVKTTDWCYKLLDTSGKLHPFTSEFYNKKTL